MITEESLMLILDEGISSEALQKAIKKQGVACEMLIQHFERGTPDETWLPAIGQKGWILLCKDRRIAKNTIEYTALMNAHVGAFFLVSANISGQQIIECVTKAIPAMMQIVRTQQKPFLAKIYKNGKMKIWQARQSQH